MWNLAECSNGKCYTHSQYPLKADPLLPQFPSLAAVPVDQIPHMTALGRALGGHPHLNQGDRLQCNYQTRNGFIDMVSHGVNSGLPHHNLPTCKIKSLEYFMVAHAHHARHYKLV